MRRRVAAVVLAAGRSHRMGANKLLHELEGEPLVARVVDAALASAAEPVWVVTGHEAERVRAALAGRPVRFAHNPGFEGGMGTSLAAGAAALDDAPDGVLVCLGDMPWVRAAHLDALIDAFDPEAGAGICVPVHAGRRGHPVLFASRYLPELRALGGDAGARRVTERHSDAVRSVPVEDAGVLRDVDTPAELEEAARIGR